MADIKGLFSERAQQNEEFKNKVILPTDAEFNKIKRFIDAFPDLVSLDYAPRKYMKLIGQTFGYPYLETEDPDVQREIYKRLVEIYHKKGSLELFEKALGYAYSEAYALGDMTYYHEDPIEEANWKISYPRDIMFRYDYSHWDYDKYADTTNIALGIIDVESDHINDRVLTYLDSLVPAGIKYTIGMSKYITGDDFVFPYLIPEGKSDMIVEIKPSIVLPYSTEDIFTWDEKQWDEDIYDGKEVISYGMTRLESHIGLAFAAPTPSDQMETVNMVATWCSSPALADEMRFGSRVPMREAN